MEASYAWTMTIVQALNLAVMRMPSVQTLSVALVVLARKTITATVFFVLKVNVATQDVQKIKSYSAGTT